jgi:hypothetical protein
MEFEKVLMLPLYRHARIHPVSLVTGRRAMPGWNRRHHSGSVLLILDHELSDGLGEERKFERLEMERDRTAEKV